MLIASVNIAVALLKNMTEKEDRRFAHLATCRCGASAVLSSNAQSLVTDENTGE